MIRVAALYVDPRGPYPSMPSVDCWDEARDARLYAGPHPVVAHPPCGPWSRLRRFCTRQPADCAPIAVAQVRCWGGVLEHPASSTLWRECGLPLPGGLPDEFGGWSIEVDQVAWGHRAREKTWLYVVGVGPRSVAVLRGGTPTHCVNSRKRDTALKELSAQGRRRTPPAFAAFLVDIARRAAPVLAVLLVACGAPEDPSELVLTPTDDLRELVEQAAPQWSQPTGIDIRIGAGGIAVETAEETFGPDGKPVCGITPVRRGKYTHDFQAIERVVIATKPPPGCPGWKTGRAVLHELGHVVCEWGVDELPENHCHSVTGLMAQKANDTKTIDAESLETVCRYAACARFEPEQ